MPEIGAVITGGDFQGLGVVRSLGRRGIPVYIIDHEFSIGRFSRYSKQFSTAPKPELENTYFNFLLNIAQKNGVKKWVLYPNNDRTVYFLSRFKDKLKNYYRIPTPNWETIKYIYDKKNTYQLAEKLNICIPKTFYPHHYKELEDLKLNFPVIIKPSIRDNFYDKTKIKAYLIEDREQLFRTYKKVTEVIDPSEVLIQEFIPGGPKHLYSFCPFFKEGKVIAKIMARRSRQHPMDFGHATTFAEAVDIPEIEEIGKKFLSHINYYGLAEVEFMKDPRDGKYKFIEVNARVWGWHTLAVRAGADLPFMLFQDITGQKVEVNSYRKDVKWVRLTTDIPTVLTEIIKRKMSLDDYLNSLRGKKEFAVFSWEDPLPFLAEILMIPYLWVKRGF